MNQLRMIKEIWELKKEVSNPNIQKNLVKIQREIYLKGTREEKVYQILLVFLVFMKEKNLIMMKLNKTTGNKLKEALKQGFASSIEHAVYDAVNFWLKKSLDEKQYSVKPLEGRPYIAEALDDGLFKNVGEVIEEALNNLEWRLSR